MSSRAVKLRRLTTRVTDRGAPCDGKTVLNVLASTTTYAGRLLLLNGGIGFTSVTVFSLKLGIGNNTPAGRSFGITGCVLKLGLETETANRLGARGLNAAVGLVGLTTPTARGPKGPIGPKGPNGPSSANGSGPSNNNDRAAKNNNDRARNNNNAASDNAASKNNSRGMDL